MKKTAVIFWSGTGNTEAMANAVLAGMQSAGADAVLLSCAEVDSSMIDALDAVALGCPAMGAEVLEEGEFEPMFSAVEGVLAGKKVGLFGSWGWGEGVWMQDWESRCAADGAKVAGTVTCQNAPDDGALEECRALGRALA